MMFSSTAIATRVDDLHIEDLDRSLPGTAQFTWCIQETPGAARTGGGDRVVTGSTR